LRMPGLSEMQVLEKIKTIDPAIVVIIITAYASEETVREGDRLQVFAIITKPFSVSHLREAVRRAVAHRSH
jgi:DNA-binding NtrC family response regulator